MARLRVAACIMLLLAVTSAAADPVTLVTLATFGAQVAGFLTPFQAFAIVAGLTVARSAQARRKQKAAQAAARAQYNASLQDRNVTVLSNESSWKVVYGNPAPVGGSVVAILSSGAKDEYKHLVVVFAAHPCQAIDEIYIEGEPVGALDANGWCTAGVFFENGVDATITEQLTVNGSGQVTTSRTIGSLMTVQFGGEDYVGQVIGGTTIQTQFAAGTVVRVSYQYAYAGARVNVQKHLSPGGVDTADAFLISQVPDKWTAAHRLSGYTYAVVTLDLNFGRFQGGPPNISARLRGKNDIWDFRTSTRGYTNNPALCLADYIASSFGLGATLSQIDSAAAIAAANACDAQGFTCDGVVDTAQARETNQTMLEDCMAGSSHFSAGVWRIIAGAWSSPVMDLTDETTLAAPIEVIQASNPREGRYNGVRGRYVAAGGLGVSGDMPPYSVASYLSADGAALVQDMDFPLTPTAAQCTKLAAIAVERARLGLTIRYPAHLHCWRLQPGDRVRVANTEFGFALKSFRVVDWDFEPSAPVGLVLTEDNAAVYTGTFNAQDYQLVTSNLRDPFARPTAPENLAAASGTGVLLRAGDGTIITRVQVTWTATILRNVLSGGYLQLQWRLATDLEDRWVNVDLPADASGHILQGPIDGTTILLRVRFVSSFGMQGAWSTITHRVLGKTEAPTAPGFVTATQGFVFWGAVTDVDLAGYRIRAFPGATGAVWSRATPLHNDLLTTGPWPISTRLYGVQTIMVVSEDTTGNISTPVSTVLDFGQPDASNAVQSRDYGSEGFPGTFSASSVSGGAVVANVDGSSNLYALTDLYGEADVYATTYAAMQWVSQAFAPAYGGGTLTLSASVVGPGATIEYQTDGDALSDLYSSADVYAASELYGSAGAWAPWPGATSVQRMVGIRFRVSVVGGGVQGRINTFTPQLVMPDVRQTFSNVLVDVNGTRLAPTSGTPARSWILIKTVQGTPIVDGSGAVAPRVLDFSPGLGPLVQVVNGSGTAVQGRVTFDIGGLADG